MDPPPHDRVLRYHVVISCLWQECGATPEDRLIWRYSLEHPRTAERYGFHDLGALAAFLSRWTDESVINETTGERGVNRRDEPIGKQQSDYSHEGEQWS